MLRQYREYILLIIKSISKSILIFTCFFAVSFILFDIYLSDAFFYTGVSTIIVSVFLYSLAEAKFKKRWEMTPAILMGAAYSIILSALNMISGTDVTVSVLCLLFNTYLWKLGWDIYSSDINYEIYRSEFSKDFKILIALIAVSILSADSSFMSVTGRFTIIYIIMGPVLLKNSRDLKSVNTERTKKSERTNMLFNILVVFLMLFASSDMFISYILTAAKFIFSIGDKVLEVLLIIIGYAVAFIITPIINWFLRHRTNMNYTIDSKNDDKNILPEAVNTIVIPYGIKVAIKLMLLALIIFILIKLYRVYASKNRHDEFTESREFVLDTDEVGKNIKTKLSSLFSKLHLKRKPSRTDLKGRIRYIYYDFLELSIKLGNYNKIDETPIEIRENTEEKCGTHLSSVEALTSIYQEVRYGQSEPTIEEYKQTEKIYNEIKERLPDN